MLRRIAGFAQDDAGGWVAELSCLHGQHIRHSPPFQNRPWVLTGAGRQEHVDTDMDCPLCDRAELPGDLEVTRTAGPFDRPTHPKRQTFVLLAGVFVVVLLLAVISTLAA